MSTNIFNPADQRHYPDQWPRYRGKQLFEEIDDRSETGEEELLSVSHITGITPRSQKNVTMFQAESLVGYKRCQVGDIAANTMWTWQGAIGVSQYAGVVSPAYNVYRQRGDYYNPRFLDLLLREPALVDVYHSLSTGIRPSRLRLYPKDFLTIDFPVPPRDEQEQIVQFLDWKCSSLNRLMRLIQQAIDSLWVFRARIIDDAVTHGLKNSSLIHNDGTWDVTYPVNWHIERNQALLSFRKGLSITKADLTESGVPVISYGQVHSKANHGTSLEDVPICHVPMSFLTDKTAVVEKGDFIFADTSENLDGCGNAVYVDDNQTLLAGYHTIIGHPKTDMNSKYLAYLFASPTYRNQIRSTVNGVKVYSVTQQILKGAYSLIPPKSEQNEIVAYLDEKCTSIDTITHIYRSKIKTLALLKATLVAKTVTGKISVLDVDIPSFEHFSSVSEEQDAFDFGDADEEQED